MLKLNNRDLRKCFHLRSGEIRHLCDSHSCGMPILFRKYREVHKSVARTIVRHRVAHYALLASPPRAREDPEPRLSDWNRIPFRRFGIPRFFRVEYCSVSLSFSCARANVASFRPSRAVLWERRDSRRRRRRMGDSRGDKDDRVEE